MLIFYSKELYKMETTASDTLILVLGAIVGIVLLAAAILRFVTWLSDFQKELDMLNTEIGRTTGHEQQYWIVRRRRLWLSIIPFVRY